MSGMPLSAAMMADALNDFSQCLARVMATEADVQRSGFSSVSWTTAHVGQHVDSWILGAIGRRPRSLLFSDPAVSKGAPGGGVKWTVVEPEFKRIHREALDILRGLSQDQLEVKETYAGSIQALRGHQVDGNYRLVRLTAHIYYHIGDICTTRAAQGITIEDFPGLMSMSVQRLA